MSNKQEKPWFSKPGSEIDEKKVHVGDWITNGCDVWLRCEDGKFVNISNGEFETPFGDLSFTNRDELL